MTVALGTLRDPLLHFADVYERSLALFWDHVPRIEELWNEAEESGDGVFVISADALVDQVTAATDEMNRAMSLCLEAMTADQYQALKRWWVTIPMQMRPALPPVLGRPKEVFVERTRFWVWVHDVFAELLD